MVKVFLFYITIFISLSCFSQDSTDSVPTMETTQKFISETLKKFSYNDESDGTNNKYVVSFNDSMMFIFNLQRWKKYYTILKVKDIDKVIILEKPRNVWLTVQLKPNRKEFTMVDSIPLEDPFGFYEFLLSKSFVENDLPEKIKKAFSNLTKLYK